jgi:hypothetical protein
MVSVVACGTQAPAPSATTPAGDGAPAPAPQAEADLNQLMRGVLFPNSNVIFAAQATDPTTVKPAGDPALATDPLATLYGGWMAVENSGLAIAEAADLLMISGRVCSNGKPVPVQNADWPKFVAGLREAGLASYKAAQSKDMDRILEAAEVLSTACLNCHEVYREKTAAQGGEAGRCVQP